MLKPATVGILYGAVMIPLGAIAYFASGQESWTPFLGSIAGLVVLIPSLIANGASEKVRMHAMHVVALFLLLALLGSASRLPSALGEGFGLTAGMLLANSLISAIALGVMIKSFIDVRRARDAAKESEPASDAS